jgi:hypothetical protein
LLDKDWNPQSQLKSVTFYRSWNCSVHIPFDLHSLQCVKLGIGIRLQLASSDVSNVPSQDLKLSIKNLWIVKEVPDEFLSCSFLCKLVSIEKLSLTIPRSGMPQLSHLNLLSNLYLLQLLCNDRSMNSLMEHMVKSELLSSIHMKYVLLNDCHLYKRLENKHILLTNSRPKVSIVNDESQGNPSREYEQTNNMVWSTKKLNTKKKQKIL